MSAPLPPPQERVVESLSPEARRERAAMARTSLPRTVTAPGWQVLRRTLAGTFNDGFIHAGNLAYLAMVSIFPFFILGAAIFSLVGDQSDRAATISTLLYAMPPMVADVIEPVARDVIEARTGWWLWAGALLALWTVSSLIETIRDILRRAYGTRMTRAFWKYRLFSVGIIVGSVVLLMLSLFAQVAIGAASQVIDAYFPQFPDVVTTLQLSQIVPVAGLYLSLYLLFVSLTPRQYRARAYPKWPGVLFITVWWMLVTGALPPLLRSFFSYDRTYGSFAGIMVTLLFFWLVGLGMVMGAELNAALAETPEEQSNRLGPGDDRRGQ